MIGDARRDPDAAVVVAAIEALGHDDPMTRMRTLTSGVSLPPDVLIKHALHDARPAVRAEALVQLPRNDARADAVAQTALHDPDPDVWMTAREVLKMIRPPEPSAVAGETQE